jgi:peptidoglycan DL-endopeptidase CwlO
LREENNKKKEATRILGVAENTLEAKIAALQANISQLEKQISENTTKSDQLKLEIAKADAEIKKQQAIMSKNVRLMYLEGDMSTLEMLVGSDDLSEYLDKEQYRSVVQEKIKRSLDKITALKKEQERQKVAVEKLLSDQNAMKVIVAEEKKESDRLLSLNQEQQSEFNKQIAVTNSQITNLQQAQAEENERILRAQAVKKSNTAPVARSSSSGNTVNGRAYPWANVPFPNSRPDPWGMYMRQCVSYTAWKVAASGRFMPYWGGRGNAKQWANNARAAGILVDRSPRAGDVAVSTAGTYGHVMYVEAVYSNGNIDISQYNASWTGTYSEAHISPGNLEFIHF